MITVCIVDGNMTYISLNIQMYQMNSLNYISNYLITHNQQVNSVIKTFLYRNTKKIETAISYFDITFGMW